MKTITKLFAFSFLLLTVSTQTLAFSNLPTSGAMPDVVHLRKDCAAGNPNLANCADNMTEMLTWVWGTRNPSASSPLLIDVGPGEFLDFNCQNRGFVTVRGSGRDNTIISNSASSANSGAAVFVSGCSKLAFQDLTISGNGFGIQWWQGGSSTYSNVHVKAVGFAWWDYRFLGGQSVHYWFGSKLESTGASAGEPAGLFAYDGEHWFYGGEIAYSAQNVGATDRSGAVVLAATGGVSPDVHIFGTAVRAFSAPGGNLNAPLVAVRVEAGEFHMHGGIINADASAAAATDADAYAIFNRGGGGTQLIHTPDTAFSVTAKGGGSAMRIAGDPAKVNSPFLWPAGNQPPLAGSVKSGADQFVENDCSVAGNCNAGGNETHLMIANPGKCGATDPWFDTQTGECRAVNTP